MHLFETTPLLYLSLNALAYLFMMIGVLGIPGNPDENNKTLSLVLKIWGMLLPVAWRGIPYVALASVLAFYFRYDTIGKILSCTSLSLGMGLFLILVVYYSIQPGPGKN